MLNNVIEIHLQTPDYQKVLEFLGRRWVSEGSVVELLDKAGSWWSRNLLVR